MRYDIREDRAYACDDAVLRKAHVLARDVAGNIWVGTWGAGVVRLVNPLAPGPTRYVHYKHVPGRTHSLLDDIIYDIEENPEQNTIWIGGRSGLSTSTTSTIPIRSRISFPATTWETCPITR